ncbi:MAG: hypothetical protein IS632_06385 [Thaumarchaeota archaeon]|nr:hypothetical protein [Nitrososphaerota archaeon]
MGGASGRRPFVWYVAALAAVGALAAAGGQAACAAGIGVVGGAQATLYDPSMGQFADIDSFKTPDGHSYLLALRYDRIYTIDVTEPFRPVRAGGITHDRLAGSLFWNVDIFRTPDGRVYAAVTGDGFSILDVTDPANPETVYGVPEGADNASFGDAWQVTVYERPDGRVHALVTGGNNALRAVDITDPYNPVALGGGPDLVPAMALGGSAALYGPGDGRIYVMYGSNRMGVSIMDVTDPVRPVLVSAIRHYDGDHPLGHEDYRAHGIPAPSSSDVLISDWYAEGLDYANEVAVFGSPDGRTYAMVANGMATIQVQSPGVSREPPQYDMVANGMATIQTDESDPHIVPAGIIFLDVTDPHAPAPAGAILYGEDGFDFGSGIRNTAIREGPVPFPEGHSIAIAYPIRDIAILDLPDGRVHAAVAGDRGVTILDVTDPAGPVLLSHIWDGEDGFDHIDTVRGMDVVESPGGGAYLAMAGNEGVQMVDVTDPGEPVGAGSILGRSVHFAKPAVFGSDDGRTYVLGVGGGTVSMVEITDPSLPVPLGSIRDGEEGFDTLDSVWQVEALHAADGRIYAVAAGGEGLQVIEVTDPRSPAPAGTLRNGTDGFEVGSVGWTIISTAVLERPGGGGYLLVADHDRGIYAVDVTDPRAPALAGSLRGGEGGIDLLGGVHDMDVFGGPDGRPYALMTGDVGIHTIDMADPTTPVVAGTLDGSGNGAMGGHTLTLIHQSVVFESAGGRIHALLVDYTSGIHIIDLTDPYAPTYMGSVPVGEGGVEVIPGSAVAAVASPDGNAYALVAGWDDIQILNITDPYAPAPAGAIPAGEGGLGLEMTPWYIITMEPAGGRIHALASGGDRLWVLDVTHPSPVVPHVGRWDGEGHVSGGGPLNIRTVGAAVPYHPGLAGMVVHSPAGNVAIIESPDGHTYAVHVGPAGGLLAVDITGPHTVADSVWWPDPRKAGWPPTALDGLDMAPALELFKPHDGRTYMMIGGDDTILVVDITYPTEPAAVSVIRDNLGGFYSLGAISDISAFASPDGRVHVLVGGGDGIQVIDVTNPYAPSPTGSIYEVPGIPAYGGIHRTAATPTPDGRVIALAVDGAGRAGMLDITDPRLPVPAGTLPSADGAGPILDIVTLEASGGRLHALLVGENISRIIDITDPGDPVPVAILDAAAPERPQDGPYAESGVARVAIRAGSSDAGCVNEDGCYFVPRTVTIGVGDTVTWSNEDDTAHGFVGMLDTDYGTGWAFQSGALLPGAEFSHKFGEAGEYTYYGSPHPWMTGRVVVEAAE